MSDLVATHVDLVALRAAPTRRAEQVSEAICGEVFAVRDRREIDGDGWLQVQGADDYVSWLPESSASSCGCSESTSTPMSSRIGNASDRTSVSSKL